MSSKITSLEVQQGNKERVNVHLDGEFAFGLNLMDAALLRIGQELSSAEIAALKAKDQTAQALDSAIRFLGHRPRSSAEIRRRLAEKGIEASVIEVVIERLIALNYVNDLEFARYWVHNREEFNPRGKRALRFELRQKGVANDIIEEALADTNAEESAYLAAQKKIRLWRGRDAQTLRLNLSQFLARRGFDYDVIQSVVKRIVKEFKADDVTEDFYDEE